MGHRVPREIAYCREKEGSMRPSADFSSVGRATAARSLTKEDDEVG